MDKGLGRQMQIGEHVALHPCFFCAEEYDNAEIVPCGEQWFRLPPNLNPSLPQWVHQFKQHSFACCGSCWTKGVPYLLEQIRQYAIACAIGGQQ